MIKTSKTELQPFKMQANIYFIGNERVSVHLIDTDKGLVMIDTGYPDMYELILSNIEKLGFNIKDLVAIFHSHGHIDHFGCTSGLVEVSKAKTYISRIDNDIANGNLDLSWATELGLERIPPFSCDVLIEDGNVFDFGNTSIRCVLSPGHTDGTLSFFISLSDGTVAAMHGGIGLNTLSSVFLNARGLSFDCRNKYRQTIARLKNEYVDLVLGNHPDQNNTQDKMIRVMQGDTDIRNSKEWSELLLFIEEKINELEKKDPTPK